MKTIIAFILLFSSTISLAQEQVFNYSSKTGVWGFVKTDGTEITPCQYKGVSYFSKDGYATGVNVSTKEAVLINSKGEEVDLNIKGIIDLEYIGETEKNAASKLLIAKVGKKVGVINLEGKTIHAFEYDKITASGNQFMIGHKASSLSILNSDGSVIALPGMIDVRDLKEGLAPYRAMNKLFGFVDAKGKIVIEAQYVSVGYFSNGLAWVKNATNLVGFIDKTGKPVIDASYSMVKEFDVEAKRALAKKGEEMFFLSPTGEEMKIPDATKLGNYTNGYAYAFRGELVGFVDPSGKWVVEPQFETVHDFSNGLARVKRNGLWGFVNTKGELVIEPQFEDAEDMKNGYAAVMKDGQWGIIDAKGTFVIEPKYAKLK